MTKDYVLYIAGSKLRLKNLTLIFSIKKIFELCYYIQSDLQIINEFYEANKRGQKNVYSRCAGPFS
jgi:hypothetical protein